ncbi:hypothetical protein Moror_1009 [Moniliophthora roreri MCA 2997]|uniref:Thioesterase family protein n=2 Tax=Moniliophthora roreri TaxID=221103 RepID=V2XQT0_MONRO|nr:hypothetical protein Moror_1009 [Moniliophthora roreri MCA 2997]KAI3616358.1 hypothetical protein WG66_013884 [Moniliophthora roreri]
MAPFHKALQVDFSRKEGDVDVYTGVMDEEWCVGSVPNGGYALGLIIEACMKRQAAVKLSHPDPVHVTAHFLRTTAVSPFEVHIRQLKTGKGFTNLTADLIQQDVLRITTHQIFGDLKPGASPGYLTLAPPSSFARRPPLYQHPSTAPLINLRSAYRFASRLKASREPEIADRTQKGGDGNGIEWGQWLTYTDEEERLTAPMMAFAADMFRSPPSVLPKSERPGLPTVSWFPTMTMTLEFKFPLPPTSSNRTFGLYTNCRFINDPRGRHDIYVEVWSAPCNLGEGKAEEGWKEKQVCLAVSTQTALIIPMEANMRIGNKGKNKL